VLRQIDLILGGEPPHSDSVRRSPQYFLPSLKRQASYWQLLPYLKPEVRTIAIGFFFMILFVAFWPVLAWLVGQMMAAIGDGDVGRMGFLALITILGQLIQKVGQYGKDTKMAAASLSVTTRLRKQVYNHLQQLSLDYFETAQTGDLAYRLTEDIERVGEVVNKFCQNFVTSSLELIAILGYMMVLNWQLTFLTLVIAPLMALLVGWFGEKILDAARRSQSRVSDLSSLITEVVSGIRLVKAFAAEDYEIERFSQEADRNQQARYRAAWLQAIQHPIIGFLQALAILIILLLGAWQISRGNLTGPQFGSYVAAIVMLINPIAGVTANYNEFKQGQASLDRVFDILYRQPAVIESASAFSLPPVTGKVEYQDVWFSYQAEQPVLRGVSLTAQPGEVIALVGSSGAGKTTLVNLLPRFYDTHEGEIRIDGISIRDVTLGSLRRQIGIVPQETTLFSGTIAQNIAFGQAKFDLDAVIEAAQVANADQFIRSFPEGYNALLGERGVNLSGGQRQRLAIARAVLLNPRILILDEATSALDAESEALVQEALERVMQGRTVFIIAHRLATVRRATRILVMEGGRITESGTHDQLLALEGRYSSYYYQQFRQALASSPDHPG
jgi:ATP-binding cassette, subfamily B, bacterial